MRADVSPPNCPASARAAYGARYGAASPELAHDSRASGGGQLPTPKESRSRQPSEKPSRQLSATTSTPISRWISLGSCPPPLARGQSASSGEAAPKRALDSWRAKAGKLGIGSCLLAVAASVALSAQG